MSDKSDTIDLIKLLDTIIRNFKTVIFILIIGFLVALFLTYSRSPQLRATVEIFPVTKENQILTDYAFVVDTNIAYLKQLASVEKVSFNGLYDANKLLKKFVNEFSNMQIVRKNFLSINQISANYHKSLGEKYKINTKIVADEKKYFLSFKTRTPEKDLKIIANSIRDINNLVFEEMRLYGYAVSSALLRYKEFNINKLENELKVLKSRYDLKIERQKSFLNENKKIALALDIKMMNKDYVSQIEESLFQQDYTDIDEFYSDNLILPYYLRGYETIDRELSMLEARNTNNIENYDLEYANTLIELEKTKQVVSLTSNQIDEILAEIDNFEAAIVDLNQVKYSQTLPYYYLYLIVLICALVIAIIYVAARESYLEYKVNK